MDFNDTLQEMMSHANEWISSKCIVNGSFMSLDEIECMGWKEFGLRSKVSMPLKLYKYFPNTIKEEKNTNYSLLALKNNTVYLSSPTEFDDVYDSDINIEYVEYERLRLIEYCGRCGIITKKTDSTQVIGNKLARHLFDVFMETGDYEKAIIAMPETKLKEKSNKVFILKIRLEMTRGDDLGKALSNVIRSDYDEYMKSLKESFRISCFSTNPYSQLMWGKYADCHRGFCVEYTVLPNDERFQEIYLNLYPMVYCKTRPEMSERIVKAQNEAPTNESVWDIYFHGALRKSIDWVFQNEWRLLLPRGMGENAGYNMPFFPITKVYLGNRMRAYNRREIIRICNEKRIPYAGVTKNADIFEMVECPVKCEDCAKYLQDIKNAEEREKWSWVI